ncbi:uncharacterized protein LOC119397131 [Rhipicephalus sanguineus]|uniref:uncharacterized protein LOC119397131 n=1 Tax=Rhipicephalus sanguineus TaxID=34632 RepID=UPI0018937760|nr:uncharacterized protein LOC119397131 [Rhipicephalus sanguineus]
MAPVVLRYGFSKITWPEDHFRRKALENGAKLCKARYAYDVEEAVPCRDSDTQVTAKCHSQVHQTSYNVTLQLSSQRVISGATCSCKAGSDGACKHVAAVALELNNLADATSSTDVPQVWGRPASKPNTSKKESVEELFGEYKPLYIGGKPPDEQPPSFILEHFPDLDCIMQSTLKWQKEEEAMSEVRDCLEDLISKAALNADLCLVKEVLNWRYSLPLYTLEETVTMSANELNFFSTKVECTESQAELIAAQTIPQAKCTRWHQERACRISSTVAHRIICRKRSFESLAEQLKKTKSFYSPATEYGITMEPMARKVFEKKVGTRVTQVGLVIHPQQPWLCASPDGLFHTSKGITLLEIKCPYSRKDDVIIDPDLCESFISYVVYEDGCLKLTRSHPYYCQVQVAMYVTNTTECFFLCTAASRTS